MFLNITHFLFKKRRYKTLYSFLEPIYQIFQRDYEWLHKIEENVRNMTDINELDQRTFEIIREYLFTQISDLETYIAQVKRTKINEYHLDYYRQSLDLLIKYKNNINDLEKAELPNLLYFYSDVRSASNGYVNTKQEET
ncbi:hypothetical protein A3844_07305 [Paenibacillus helianthi]|uniref:Uncharacterized protein n=2 Tax=Paenibacillus helianthi TaxID=1349432 RepID=A0ABX3ETV6_9BACL|nr:hypothetical protein A3844_07305 [Paenibacillus helianthi]